jgi:hypothetical protein
MRRIAQCALVASLLTPPVGAAPLPCEDLVPYYQSNNYNWWWGALGNCKSGPGGITDAGEIFECAWDQVDRDHRLDCLREELEQAPITAQGIDVVAAFNARPTCDQLHVKYMQNNYSWWWGALGNCKTGPPGPTDAHDIFRCAWAYVPPVDRQECLRRVLWAAPVTHQGIAVVAQYNTPQACAQLEANYQANNFGWWWNALGTCKTGPGGPSTRDAIFACAWALVPPAHKLPCLRDLFESALVTTQGIAEVRRHNSLVDGNGKPDSVADNAADVPLGDPEACDLPTDGTLPEGYFEPAIPLTLAVGAGDEGRRRPDLREVARLAEPTRCSLPLAAHRYAQATVTPTAYERLALLAEAQAYADLAVTGRRSFERFREDPPGDAYCAAIAGRQIAAGCPPLGLPPPPDALVTGCQRALKRAYDVANHLRTGQAVTAAGPWFDRDGKRTEAAETDHRRKLDARTALGWIAVSGEDDLPHRPVNVPSSDWPQFEIDVEVEVPHQYFGSEAPGTLGTPFPERVHARYVIAQSRGAALSEAKVPDDAPYTLLPDRLPSIPIASDVLLFIHGMDSRAEEAELITRELFARHTDSENPRNLVVIAVDLPSSGYTETLDYDLVSPLSAIGHPDGIEDFSATGHTPLLDFLETFVVRFAEALHEKTPFLGNVDAVMGGSLGGNLSFRLGRRPNVWWLSNVIAWSPASIWESMAGGNDLIKHKAVRTTWLRANDRDPADPLDLGPLRSDRRPAFFVNTWDKAIEWPWLPMSQPDTWTSKRWPCRDSAIKASRLDRHETYDPKFLAWRWRLATEQLIYSHVTHEWSTGEPRYMANDKRMLLACGEEDDVTGNNICDSTWWTAARMNQTPGRMRYFRRTGHTLDGERPRYWALEIAAFLGL